MAKVSLTQPALYLDTYPIVSPPGSFSKINHTRNGDLFAVEFPGITLMMTPHALIGLIGKSKASIADWSAMQAAKLSGFMVDEEGAEVIPFPKRAKPPRRKVGHRA